MSREHCRLEFANGKLLVTDLASSHGLTYRGRTLASFEIDVGDGFHVGQTFIRFDARATGVEQPAAVPAPQPVAVSQPVPVPQPVPASRPRDEVRTDAGGDDQDELPIGAELGGFVVESVLGRSDRCTVYEAEQKSTHRKVALKVLRRLPPGTDAAEERARFLADVRTAASVADPLLVQVFDIGQVGEDCFAALELVQGQCLAERIDHGRRMQWAELVPVLSDILQALEVLHLVGLIHGAVKPANVFLLAKGGSKLADPRSNSFPRAEEEPSFSAPEQLSRQLVDARADLYAVGCVAYAALAGRPPFMGSARRIAEAQQRSRVPSLLPLDASIPPALDQLIRELLAKEPSARPTTEQARDDLLDIQNSTASIAAPPPAKDVAEPEVEYPTIPVAGQSAPRSAPRRRKGSSGGGMVFQLFSQLVLYVMILVAGLAVALAMKHKNPDWDIYRLLEYLRPPDASTAPR
jgi:serine/threonine protein kinase